MRFAADRLWALDDLAIRVLSYFNQCPNTAGLSSRLQQRWLWLTAVSLAVALVTAWHSADRRKPDPRRWRALNDQIANFFGSLTGK